MLSESQLKFYSENGYLVLDEVYSSGEIYECSSEYDKVFELKQNSDLEATWKGNWTTADAASSPSTQVLSIHSLQNHAAIFTKMLLKDTLLEIVADLIGTKDILLHHTKAHLKPPGKGSPFPMHQDYQYFPYKNDSLVAVFIHLDDTNMENGGLAVYPGSHKLGPLEDKGDISGWHYVDQDKFPIDKATPVNARRGQVVIFSYLLVHGSFPNTSDRVRRMLLFQMMSAHDEKLRETHRSPCQGMVLSGRNPHAEASIKKRHETS
ncbi:phytanoyl-CoA dioxygenase, peroxisomal-like isoform X1 [Daphnia pulicaria]|uniref:phytanoyl-CoA dioxygenase, peroxisomal-like isoform X1 n=1 Tax=Daphnia pulicaria TaxID=35523 RepID=UPI001EE9F411|nr:phytanoyl-CoA dioxygenase, peroxisomal-like isoform X1 [Daphnia pulicaria]